MIGEYFSWEKFDLAVKDLYEKIPRDEIVDIYGVPRGGLPIAVRLSHLMDKPIITNPEDIHRDTLIVDDVADSGETLSEFPDNKKATIHYKPESLVIPDWYVYKTDKWITYAWEVKI